MGRAPSGARFFSATLAAMDRLISEFDRALRAVIGVGYAVIKNDPAAVFTWTGAPPTSDGASNTPFAGQDPSTYFVSITHRF